MKVLIALDHSDCSKEAMESAYSQKWPANTEFQLLHVVEPVYVSYGITSAYIQPMLDAHRDFIKTYKQVMKDTVAEFQNNMSGHEVTGCVIEGTPAQVILDTADEWKADLIIVGSHGRTGFKRFLMGSVAQKVASHAPCSVNIIKSKNNINQVRESQKHEVIST